MTKELNSSSTRNRALLAALLVGSLAANITTQALGLSVFISAAFGLVVLASGIALFLSYRKNRG
ncbi:hypothetical protein SK803_28415 [Lentzea sp. BCCO 10_0856]|uniref:LPXTG-motif cell wall anchor domain-containing protein n=1 Tax=Lentzea miocenica TaxID=3095431 RepID=A0ABU4T7L5_9PSEU|nr:hypothetical protein [Lentzea sp. BCCO 10_0856]MDX8034161.1 hypothetical protein [Lentzea sp. BCCO 10_0856]